MAHTNIDKSMQAQEKAITEFEIDLKSVDISKFESYDVTFAGRHKSILYDATTGTIIIDSMFFAPQLIKKQDTIIAVIKDHKYKIQQIEGKTYLDGRNVEFRYKKSLPKIKRKSPTARGREYIKSPLPGVIVDIHVKVGETVIPGQKVITLEAMKMQNEIVSEFGGIVNTIKVKVGEQTNTDQLLVELKAK